MDAQIGVVGGAALELVLEELNEGFLVDETISGVLEHFVEQVAEPVVAYRVVAHQRVVRDDLLPDGLKIFLAQHQR